MNGILWKWTNYYSGWQPRWFVLQDGVLSYYKSEDEVHCGSKGSINLAVCDVNVCNYDSTRFEIFVPGEQKYFLKACSTQERQRWIVTLGSSKACHMEPEYQQIQSSVNSAASGVVPGGCGNTGISNLNYRLLYEEINAKESEMRIYLDLINQQTLSIKAALAENHAPDIEVINEAGSTLNAACDTFTDSLRELMSLATSNSRAVLEHGVPISPAAGVKTQVGHPIMSPRVSIGDDPSGCRVGRTKQTSMSDITSLDGATLDDHHKSCNLDKTVSFSNSIGPRRRKSNFFYDLSYSFVDLIPCQSEFNKRNDGDYTLNNLTIYTELYILSFSSILSFLDNFNAAPINSLKSDLSSYLKRLQMRYESDKSNLNTLEKLVKSESRSTNEFNVQSVVYILRMLTRTLLFVYRFLDKLQVWINKDLLPLIESTNSNNVVEFDCLRIMLGDVYETTVKDKLNWIDKGLFTVLMKSLPSLEKFISALLGDRDFISSELLQTDTSERQLQLTDYLKRNSVKLLQLVLDVGQYRDALSFLVVHAEADI